MSRYGDGWVRLEPDVCPGEDIDLTRPLRADKRKMYPLLLRAPDGYAGELVLDCNPVAIRAYPNADGWAFAFGVVVLSILLFGGVAFLCLHLGIKTWGWDEERDAFFWAFIGIYVALGGGSVAVMLACIRLAFKKEFAHPTLFNRRTGKVIQLQGKQRVEARWEDLKPYIERINTVHLSGGSTVYHFHLVQPSEGGGRALKQICIKFQSGGVAVSAMYYRFLCDYMSGKWGALPDIPLVGGVRLPLWKQFRQDAFSFWFGKRDWSGRSQESKLLMWFLVPLWTAVWWPMYVLTFIGGRLGWVPKFTEQDLADAAWDASRDGPMPEALARKISTPEPHPEEKRLYLVSLLLGGVVWAWLLYWFFGKTLFA